MLVEHCTAKEYFAVEFTNNDSERSITRIDYTSKDDMKRSIERLLKMGKVRRACIYRLIGCYDSDEAEEVREL